MRAKISFLLAGAVLMLIAGVWALRAQAGSGMQHSGTAKSQEAAKHIEQGTAFFSKGQYEDAVRHYSEALKIDPQNLNAYNNRGVAYSKMGKYDQAISDFNRVVQLNPKFVQVYNNRSMAFFRNKEFSKACADLRHFRELGGSPSPEYVKDLESASGKGTC